MSPRVSLTGEIVNEMSISEPSLHWRAVSKCGYNGPKPARGDKPEPGKRLDEVAHFKANEVRDGHGHVVGKR